MTLNASILSIGAIRLYARKAKRDPHYADFGHVTLDEIDRLIEERWEEKRARALQIRISTIQGGLPDTKSDEVRRLITEKLPLYLADYADVCSKTNSDVLPPSRSYDHKIKFKDPSKPFQNISPLYQMSMEHLQLLKEYLQENLQKGFISRSQSPYASPVLYAKKPGGGWRFCMDYRKLNTHTEIDLYPLPLIDEVLNKLQGVTIFTKVDMRQAFNRIRIHPDSVDLTTFRTRYGTYRYNVLPFGLCNGPATFQRYINEVLFDLLDECCTAYVDDILIYSTNAEEHEGHVKAVLDRLRKAGLHIDIKKSEFSVTRTKFLGFIISTEGIAVDPEKIDAIRQWQEPETVKGVQSFLGFCNFYRRFIRSTDASHFPSFTSPRLRSKVHGDGVTRNRKPSRG